MERQSRRFHNGLTVDQKMAARVMRDHKGFIPSKATILTHSHYLAHTKIDSVGCFVVATDFPKEHAEAEKGHSFMGKRHGPRKPLCPAFVTPCQITCKRSKA